MHHNENGEETEVKKTTTTSSEDEYCASTHEPPSQPGPSTLCTNPNKTFLKKLIPQLVSPSKRLTNSSQDNHKPSGSNRLNRIGSTESIHFLKCDKYKVSSKSKEEIREALDEGEICIIKPMAVRPKAPLPSIPIAGTSNPERPSTSASFIEYHQQSSHLLSDEEDDEFESSKHPKKKKTPYSRPNDAHEPEKASSAFQAFAHKRTRSQASSQAEPIHMTLEEVRQIMHCSSSSKSKDVPGDEPGCSSSSSSKAKKSHLDSVSSSLSPARFRSQVKSPSLLEAKARKVLMFKRAFGTIIKQTTGCYGSEASIAPAGSNPQEHEPKRERTSASFDDSSLPSMRSAESASTTDVFQTPVTYRPRRYALCCHCTSSPFSRRALPPVPLGEYSGSSFRFNMMAEEKDELENLSAGPRLRGMRTSMTTLKDSTICADSSKATNSVKKARSGCFTCHMVHRYICPPVCAKKSFYDQMPPGVLASPVIDRERLRLIDYAASIERVKDCGWYWGPITGEMAEKLLENEPSGSFVVRDSSDEHYIFSLTFKLNGMVRHVRIEHSHGNFSFGTLQKFRSSTIVDFIENAMLHSRSGRYLFFLHRRPIMGPLRVQLLHPVSRFKNVQSLQHNCRFVILKHVRRDQITELPLPAKLRAYLDTPYYYSEQLVVLYNEMINESLQTSRAVELKRKKWKRLMRITKLVDVEQVLTSQGYSMPPPHDYEALDFLRKFDVIEEPQQQHQQQEQTVQTAQENQEILGEPGEEENETFRLLQRLNHMVLDDLIGPEPVVDSRL